MGVKITLFISWRHSCSCTSGSLTPIPKMLPIINHNFICLVPKSKGEEGIFTLSGHHLWDYFSLVNVLVNSQNFAILPIHSATDIFLFFFFCHAEKLRLKCRISWCVILLHKRTLCGILVLYILIG